MGSAKRERRRRRKASGGEPTGAREPKRVQGDPWRLYGQSMQVAWMKEAEDGDTSTVA